MTKDVEGALRALVEGRTRTLAIAKRFMDEDLRSPAADYLSPPVWDLGHIANFEDLWIGQRLGARDEARPGTNDTYDAFRHPRPQRPSLPLLDRAAAYAYLEEVREGTLRLLLERRDDTAAFLAWMVVLHEMQHQETLLQSLVMRRHRALPAPARPPRPAVAGKPRFITRPAGRFRMGRPLAPGVYDNEAPPHTVDVPAHLLADRPVTCGEYAEFVEAGGYTMDELWTKEGRAWRDKSEATMPLYWRRTKDGLVRSDLRGDAPIGEVQDELVCHVSWFEAVAYAAWRGARLPTEAEWEAAACQVGDVPWGQGLDVGRANVDHDEWGPGRAGSRPLGRTPDGIAHLIGDVWEWTTSDFLAYPGFKAYPYDEYSKAFFGPGHKVLRGGSWATRGAVATGRFRNWDLPGRRQIFAGIRLARDAVR